MTPDERAAIAREVLTLNCERTEVLICALDEYAAACGEHVGSIAREHDRRGRSDTVALWGRRAVVVGDLLADLRTASELSDLAPEATGQDVAGNGHVASADEATGSLREAPTAPVSSSPPPIPPGAVVGYHEWTGDAWAHRLVHAPNGEARCVSPDDDLHFALTALYHARREAGELREQVRQYEEREAACCPEDVGFAERIATLERERDEARRALAEANAWRDKAVASCNAKDCAGRERSLYDALERIRELEAAYEHERKMHAKSAATSQGLWPNEPEQRASVRAEPADPSPAPASAPLSDPAPLSGAGNTGETGKPRRWWLVVDHNGTAKSVETSEAYAEWFAQYYGLANNIRYSVVPVVEARVTRETVERVEGIVRKARGTNRTSEHWAYEIVRALGLTVEADDHA